VGVGKGRGGMLNDPAVNSSPAWVVGLLAGPGFRLVSMRDSAGGGTPCMQPHQLRILTL